MLHREIIAVCSEILTERISVLCGQNRGFRNVLRTVTTEI
jgi:hypothetical protein